MKGELTIVRLYGRLATTVKLFRHGGTVAHKVVVTSR